MAQRTDAELLEIAAGSEDEYQTAALQAARAELARRDLTEEQVRAAADQNAEMAAAVRAKAEAPLRLRWIICVLLFPMPLYLLVSTALRAEGKTRKARELVRLTWLGMGAYTLILGAVAVLGGWFALAESLYRLGVLIARAIAR